MNDRPSPTDGGSRVELAHAAPFSLGAFEFRPPTREAVTPAGTESLEPRVMQVLVALHEAGGAVLTRDELIERCWDGVVVGDDAINRAIGKLRRLSEADGGASFRIENVPRVGFRLVAPSRPGTDGAKPRASRWPRWLLPVAALAGVVALAAGVLVYRQLERLPAAADRPSPLFAVLPFNSLGQGAEDQALAQSVTVAVRDALSRTGLRVISEAASSPFQGPRKPTAGKELGAQYVVDGDVQRQAGRLRISLRVDEVSHRVTVWSTSVEGASSDAEVLTQRAATDLGAAVAWPGARQVLARGSHLDPKVVGLFLQNVAADKTSRFAEALDTARRLVALAPDEAFAQSVLAMSIADGLGVISPPDRPRAISEARRAAQRALELDPGLATGYVAQARLLPDVRWDERERWLEKGARADPDNEVSYIYGHVFFSETGRLTAALDAIQHARAIDAFSVNNAVREYQSLTMLGRRGEAEQAMAAVQLRWPDAPGLIRQGFRDALSAGEVAKAKAFLERPNAGVLLDPQGAVQPVHALLRAVASHRHEDLGAAAQQCLGPVKLSGYQAATCLQELAILGDLDDAYRMAGRMFPGIVAVDRKAEEATWLAQAGATTYLFLLYDPHMAAFRADPRFVPLAERMGLAQYWRSTGRWPDFCAAEPGSACGALKRAGHR